MQDVRKGRKELGEREGQTSNHFLSPSFPSSNLLLLLKVHQKCLTPSLQVLVLTAQHLLVSLCSLELWREERRAPCQWHFLYYWR